MWTLVLIFLLASQQPEYIKVEAPDGITCAAQGRQLRDAFVADDEMEGELRWVCEGPEGEIITDDNAGE